MKRLALFLTLLCLLLNAPAAVAAPNVTGITLNTYDVVMDWDDSFQIRFTVTPADADWVRVEYVSSHPWAAQVTQSGRVYGRERGTTWITVRVVNYDGTSVAETIKVRVRDRWDSGIGIYFGSGGGCNAAASPILLIPLFVLFRFRRK